MEQNIQITPREIEDRLQKGIAKLTEQNQRLDKLAKEKAAAESKYRDALAKKIETMRSQGASVTGLKDRAKGSNEVVGLMHERDLKEAQWRACLESTRNIRTEIEVLRSLLTQSRAEAKNMM